MRIKNVAELKRFLIPGATIYMSWHVLNEQGLFKRSLPWTRTVDKIQTNGVWFMDSIDADGKRSFLEFPKATMIEFDPHGFDIYYPHPTRDGDRIRTMRYEFDPPVCVNCGSTIKNGMCGYEGDD